jgi:hypothetical protein
MRFASMLCLTLSILGCSENSPQRAPTAPTVPVTTPPPTPPPPSNKIGLLGFVVTPSGDCIEGATVEVVGGEGLVGSKATQRTPCDPVRLTGGFLIGDVPVASMPITVRASALGWRSQEETIDCVKWACSDTLEVTRGTALCVGGCRITLVPTGL